MPDILQTYFSGIADNLSETLNTPDAYLNKIAITVIAIIIGISINVFLADVIKTYMKNIKKRLKIAKTLKIIISSLTIITILFIWIRAMNALILVALSIGLFVIFLLRGLTHNIIGFFVIKYRMNFREGHRIEIGDIIGDVIEINPVSVKLLEVRKWLSSDSNTGRVIHLPNSIIFEKSVKVIGIENIFIWHEIDYTLSFESDWQEAEKIMTDAGNIYFEDTVAPKLKAINENIPVDDEELYPVFVVNTTTTGIKVTLRYMVDYREGTKTRTRLQKYILSKFSESIGIEFAPVYVNMISK